MSFFVGVNLCVRPFLTEQGLRYLCHTCGVTAPFTQTGILGVIPHPSFSAKPKNPPSPLGRLTLRENFSAFHALLLSSAALVFILCSMGFHSTFIKIAATEMGI